MGTTDSDHFLGMALPAASILAAFEELKKDVAAALHTQLGDAARLEVHVQACHRLLEQVQLVSCVQAVYAAANY